MRCFVMVAELACDVLPSVQECGEIFWLGRHY